MKLSLLKNRLWTPFIDYVIAAETSTRSAALLRIGLCALIWSRWARLLAPFSAPDTERMWFSVYFFIVTPMMFFGIFTRIATALTALGLLVIYYYFGHHQGVEPWTHHHTYLLTISTCLLALSDCGRSYSFDRYRQIKRCIKRGLKIPAEIGPRWPLMLIAIQVSLIYFWSALDKSRVGYLSGDRLEQMFMFFYFGSDYPNIPFFQPIMQISAWMTVLLEYLLVVGLWFRRTQRWLIPIGIIFHGLIYYCFPVSTFSLSMWVLYLAFIDPNVVHRFLDDLQKPSADNPTAA